MKMKIIAKNAHRALAMSDSNPPKFGVISSQARIGEDIYIPNASAPFSYDLASQFLKLYRIYYNIETVAEIMDCVDIEDYNLFECSDCGKTYSLDELCTRHYDKNDCVCKNCCPDCQEEFALGEQINADIDRLLLDEDI